MSIVILAGGTSQEGNAEHRYLVGRFLDHFGKDVSQIITSKPTVRPTSSRLKRLIRRGDYMERIARACFQGGYGPAANDVQRLLLPNENTPQMPGQDRLAVVDSHNSEHTRALIRDLQPKVIVVYGTAIIRSEMFDLASLLAMNMHTGLSPYYRGDSTLFWPVYYDEPEKLGVTVHQLVKSVDGGDIAATAPVVYEPGDTEADLFAKGVKAGTEIYVNAVQQALDGTLQLTPQDLSLGREFSWRHRTVAAERKVLAQLALWEAAPSRTAA